MKTAAFATLGCKVNQYETSLMEGLFRQAGYLVVDFSEQADVYVLNTCSVTHLGEKKSRQLIRRAARQNPCAVIAVTGCYSQLESEVVQAIDGVSVVIGTANRGQVVSLVENFQKYGQQLIAVQDIREVRHYEEVPLLAAPAHTRAFLKIQEGCTNFCSYCIIPYTRGSLRSRSMEGIVAEARFLAAQGFREIVLTGIHLGAYGRDLPIENSLADVIKAILTVPEILRIRLGSLESIEVSEELLTLMQNQERVCNHLHLPLQAAEDFILQRMNRHYTVNDFIELLDKMRDRVPNLAVSTDIITGFPGETPELFAKSLEQIKKMNFSRIHVFPYSPRKGTPAASFDGQVTEEIKSKQVKELQKLAEQSAQHYQQQFIGSIQEILVETCNNGSLEGYTRNYLRVRAKGSSENRGQIRKVWIQTAVGDVLIGTLLF